jgi:hypothetical protein
MDVVNCITCISDRVCPLCVELLLAVSCQLRQLSVCCVFYGRGQCVRMWQEHNQHGLSRAIALPGTLDFPWCTMASRRVRALLGSLTPASHCSGLSSGFPALQWAGACVTLLLFEQAGAHFTCAQRTVVHAWSRAPSCYWGVAGSTGVVGSATETQLLLCVASHCHPSAGAGTKVPLHTCQRVHLTGWCLRWW